MTQQTAFTVFHALLAAGVAALGLFLLAQVLRKGLLAKELRHFFASPLAWLVMAGFTFVNGFVFVLIADYYAGYEPRSHPLPTILFGNGFFWVLQLIIVPAITMRLIAEERTTGTLETLMTAPVTDAEVVFAKWLAATGFYMALWLTSALHMAIAYYYGLPDDFRQKVTSVGTFFSELNATMDLGPILAAYVGLGLMGSAWVALGLLCSALARDQVVAFILGFVVTIMTFSINIVQSLVPTAPSWVQEALRYASFQLAFEGFPSGAIDSRPVVYFVTLTLLGLFLSVRVVESRKWR